MFNLELFFYVFHNETQHKLNLYFYILTLITYSSIYQCFEGVSVISLIVHESKNLS